MNKSTGTTALNCPLNLKVCFPSCYWYREGKCDYSKGKEVNPMTTQTKEKQPITLKDLAKQANMEPRNLRKLLRSKFPRDKARERYEWQPGDPQIEEILQAVKNQKTNATQPKAEKPKAKTTSPKAEKTAGNVPSGAQPKNDPFPKSLNSKPIRKTAAQLKAEGVDIKPENIG
jgi:hypothetical protein